MSGTAKLRGSGLGMGQRGGGVWVGVRAPAGQVHRAGGRQVQREDLAMLAPGAEGGGGRDREEGPISLVGLWEGLGLFWMQGWGEGRRVLSRKSKGHRSRPGGVGLVCASARNPRWALPLVTMGLGRNYVPFSGSHISHLHTEDWVSSNFLPTRQSCYL